MVSGGPSPILAEGPGCDSPPLLAQVCCRCLWVVISPTVAEGPASNSFPAIPGWGLLPAPARGPLPILAEGPGRSSPPFLSGVCF